MFLIFFIGKYVCKKKKNIILLWHTISKLHGYIDTTFLIHVEIFACRDLTFNRLNHTIPVSFKQEKKEKIKLDFM